MMATSTKKTKAPSGSGSPTFAIVVERTVRLQHVLMVAAPDMDVALEQAEELASIMDDSAFDWREDASDAWSAFGRRETDTGEL
mgnify:CR=1 FL=1